MCLPTSHGFTNLAGDRAIGKVLENNKCHNSREVVVRFINLCHIIIIHTYMEILIYMNIEYSLRLITQYNTCLLFQSGYMDY